MFFKREKQFLFESNPQAPSCHASTVLPLENGKIVVAWFAGTREGAADVGIWTSVRTEGLWSRPARISSVSAVAHWNPVLHQTLDGRILLYFKVGMQIAKWQTYYAVSRDGIHWTEARELVPRDTSGGRGPVKNKCLRLSDGRLLAPASVEPGGEAWYAFVDVSLDEGFTWEKQPLMAAPVYAGAPVGLIQPTLWEDARGVHCLLRSNREAIYRSDSPDGISWNTPYRTALPNNNSGIDLARDRKGGIWLVYNPVPQNWGPRFPLVLALSRDNGETFTDVLTLEGDQGEYSYPAIVAKENCLYITYTHNRERIAFWRLWLSD